MTEHAPSFSIAYDRQQDRLTLTLQNKGVQREGKMTRRLLQGFLQGLPTWLEQHHLSIGARSLAPQAPSPQQLSTPGVGAATADRRQRAAPDPDVQVPDSMANFLIESIAVSKPVVVDGILAFRLQFLSVDKKGAIGLNLSSNEFFAVINALVDNGEGWGLVSPWPDLATGLHSPHKTHSLH